MLSFIILLIYSLILYILFYNSLFIIYALYLKLSLHLLKIIFYYFSFVVFSL